MKGGLSAVNRVFLKAVHGPMLGLAGVHAWHIIRGPPASQGAWTNCQNLDSNANLSSLFSDCFKFRYNGEFNLNILPLF